jgi:hypothetical protein
LPGTYGVTYGSTYDNPGSGDEYDDVYSDLYGGGGGAWSFDSVISHLPVPLAVTLETARATRRITKLCGGVQFRTVVPGGFASATVQLQHPLILQPDEIAHFADLTVSDTRSGEVIWQGRVEDLNRVASGDGQIWELSAIGPSSHAQDRTAQYILVDTREDQWTPSPANAKNAEVGTDSDANGTPVIKLGAPEGAVVTNAFNAEMYYDGLYIAGQVLGRTRFGWDGGRIDGDFLVRLITNTDLVGGTVVESVGLTTTGTVWQDVTVTDIPAGQNVVYFRLDCATGKTVLPDTWVIAVPTVRARLKNKAGTDITTGYTLDTVYPYEVVEDLLGRLLPLYDGTNAAVTQTFTAIDQLAYSDGATPAQVLEDLMTFEPGMYWAAWEKTAVNKDRFEWRPWPLSPRYEATILDGFESPSSAAELYNSVTVRYVANQTRRRQVKRTQVVDVLTAAGITREGFIDLGDEVASSANAIAAGDAFLEEHKNPINAATLTIARPIFDREYGRHVSPWQIRPGHLIRVRGVQPEVDWLNTARNGQTIFRIVGVDGNSDGSATLELDAFTPSMARHLTNLPRKRPTRKR